MFEQYKIALNPRHPDLKNREQTPYQWCTDKFGQLGKTWYIVHYANRDVYYFMDKDSYALFLLTWG